MSDTAAGGQGGAEGSAPKQKTAAPQAGAALSGFPSLRELIDTLRKGDVGLATGILVILTLLILPMPPVMLDMFLAVSIIFSVLVLMTGLFIQRPLEFSSFPTVLLIATMLRLGLNIASTRLILSNGHEGTAAAGNVIQSFGNLVMGGNFVIGIIVFAILVIVNFVVITKGSGRIAEVAARFTLDAMPGKQMAIDADLSAGLIDETEAKSRRKALEDESSFFGAMDGASKFVRGDAIAGLLITFINILGGIFIGVAQMELTFSEAANNYTLLTIGDGLVSQIPALIVSTAAGLLVSKAGVHGAADKALTAQFTGYPKALGMSAAVMVILALLPGMPMIPFVGLAGLAGYLAYRTSATKKQEAAKAAEVKAVAAAPKPPPEPPITDALKMDELRIELGYALLPLINGKATSDGDVLTEQIKALRRQVAGDMGVIMPPVRILDNIQLGANDYVIKVKEVEAGRGVLYPNHFMVMDPAGGQVKLPGTHTTEPTFGLPATWVEAQYREDASLRGYTVVDPATVLSTHLTETIKANISELLTYGDVQKLLKELQGEQAKLVEDLAVADHRVRCPAGAADPAQRAHFRARSRHHPGGRFGSHRHDPQHRHHRRACAHPPRPPDLRGQSRTWRLPAAGCVVAAMGTGVPGVDCRRGRRPPVGDAAEQAAGIRRPRARRLRGSRPAGRGAGALDLAADPPLRALDRRTLPRPHDHHEPGRSSPAHQAENHRLDLRSGSRNGEPVLEPYVEQGRS